MAPGYFQATARATLTPGGFSTVCRNQQEGRRPEGGRVDPLGDVDGVGELVDVLEGPLDPVKDAPHDSWASLKVIWYRVVGCV